MTITAVIVTYNRKNLLSKALEIYDKLEQGPDQIVLVDNCSTDGSIELAEKWLQTPSRSKKFLVRLQSNLGASGGFHAGLEKALEVGTDWAWVADDDAFPEANAFVELRKVISEQADVSKIAAICGQVINHGKTDYVHRRKIYQIGPFYLEVPALPTEYKKPFFELELFSYVGSCINSSYLKKYGVTQKDFFIWFDDTEHSLRLSRHGKILCGPSIRINHDVSKSNTRNTPWKYYYGIRNRLLMYKSFSSATYFMLKMKVFFQNLLTIDKRMVELRKTAVADADAGVTGIHPIYKPGFSLK